MSGDSELPCMQSRSRSSPVQTASETDTSRAVSHNHVDVRRLFSLADAPAARRRLRPDDTTSQMRLLAVNLPALRTESCRGRL